MIEIEDLRDEMVVRIVKMRSDAVIPTRGSKDSAGYDLYACLKEPIEIKPHETVKIGTGVAIQPPKGFFGGIFARSGLAAKNGLRPANCIGVCDNDYTGEYIVALHNDSNNKQIINPTDRIAQLIFLPYQPASFCEVESFEATERGDGGFGSTGK